METQPEIVAAAEAVRTWVQAQRSGWRSQGSSALPGSTPAGLVASVAAAIPAPAPFTLPIPTPEPLPEFDVSSGLNVAAPVSSSSTIVRDVEIAISVPLFARTWVRAMAGLAAVAFLAVALLVGPSGVKRLMPARTGIAVLGSEPPGAEVTIDGTPAGSTPLKLELAAGRHSVEFKMKEATRRQTIDIERGRETAVAIDWNAKPLGTLRVEARPMPARVLVDGKERGTAPLTLSDLPVGTHTVEIETAEGSVRRKVEIAEGRTESVSEEIFPGWLHVSAPIDITVLDGRRAVQLDDSNRALLKPGVHTIRLQNRALEIAETRQVTIEPGATTDVSIAPPESTLTVTGAIGAEVFVDGTRAGEIPLTDYKVPPGRHDVMVVDRSGATRHSSVTVTARPARLDVTFTSP